MSGLYIPDDWDEGADGYCTLTLTIPNSPLWKATAMGAIYRLSQPAAFDADTGDPDQAASIGQDIYTSAGIVCP